MATDRSPAYDAVDEALFDDNSIVSTTRDIRTVGEMLLDVDHLARQLLFDVNGEDAGHLIRGWPDVVFAAADLWSVLPTRSQPLNPNTGHMARLDALAATIAPSLGNGWPGHGNSDRRLVEITKTLNRAAGLVERYTGEIAIERIAVRDDIDAARVRIMHSLLLVSHAVGVSMHQHGRDRYWAARDAGKRVRLSASASPYAIGGTAKWIQRLATFEKIAGDYVSGRFPRSLTGEAAQVVDDPGRLRQALTAWDIQAHRTLSSAPTPANILLTTRTQGLISAAGLVLVDAASGAGLLHTDANTERLRSAIIRTGQAWNELASRWSDFTTPGARLDPPLIRAASEVRAACHEITHDNTSLASLDIIAIRPGVDLASNAVLQALEAGPDLAYIVAEHADNPELTGPARPLSVRAHNDVAAGLAAPRYSTGDTIWVTPTDILANRAVPAPAPVADALRVATKAATRAASAAASAAARVELTSTPEGPAGPPPATACDLDGTPQVETARKATRQLPALATDVTQPRRR